MSELGIDLADEFPKPVTDEVVAAANVIVTMGCGDSCPAYLYKKYQDWPIDDPDGQPVERVREISGSIKARVEALLVDLGIPASP